MKIDFFKFSHYLGEEIKYLMMIVGSMCTAVYIMHTLGLQGEFSIKTDVYSQYAIGFFIGRMILRYYPQDKVDDNFALESEMDDGKIK